MQQPQSSNAKGHLATPLVLLAVLFVLILPGIPFGVQAATDCGTWWVREANLHVGLALPEFGFSTCDGSTMTTADLQGKPALINFWATWCPPCVKELPNLAEFNMLEGDAVRIVGVSVDASPQDVRKFLKRKPLPYTLAWDSQGIAGGLGFDAIPVTIALDASGRVAAVHHGYASKEDLQELLKAAASATE
jgi:peroxiredoxin